MDFAASAAVVGVVAVVVSVNAAMDPVLSDVLYFGPSHQLPP